MAEKTDKETWQNSGAGQVWINLFDPVNNGKLKHTPVRSGGKILLTTEERQLNQDRASSGDLDVFMNGTLIPVRLVDTADDYEEIASNPNLLSEDDMREIFKLKAPTFKKRLSEITNSIAVSRMLEMAKEEESDLNVSMAQFKAIESRLAELRNGPEVIEVETSTMGGPPAPKKISIDFEV
jgi:hypothetical protein